MYTKAVIKKSKKDIRADGRTPIYFVLRQNRKEKLISTEKKIRPEHWNDQAGLPNHDAPNYTLLKKWINKEVESIEGIILKIENSGKPLTFDSVYERYKLGDEITFAAFSRQELEKERNLLSNKTYEDYQRSIRNIEKYQPEVLFSVIDHEWLDAYIYYGIHVKEWSPNTIAHDFRTLRKFFRKAIKKGITTSNPIEGKKIPKRDVDKEYNTPREVNQLEKLFWSNTLPLKLQKTLGFYLFSCFTCIPGDDLRNKKERLQFKDDSVNYIRGKTKRKGQLMKIPLIDRAKPLLPFIQKHNLKQGKNRVTRDLEKILERVSINKYITFHCARNTFYVLARHAGVDDRTIQDIFGHSESSTTNIYKKIENEDIKNEMNKMNHSMEAFEMSA